MHPAARPGGGFAALRSRDAETGSGAGHDTLRHTSRAKPSSFSPELFSLRSKAWALSGFGAAAWLPGSGCALSPCAYAVLLNKPSTCSVTVVSCALRCLSEQAFCHFSRPHPALVRQNFLLQQEVHFLDKLHPPLLRSPPGRNRPLPGTITVRRRFGQIQTISLSLFRPPPVRLLF